MERRYYKHKYASLAVSSALHGLIISLLLLRGTQTSIDYLIPLHHKPAQVQFYLPATQPTESSARSSYPSENTYTQTPLSQQNEIPPQKLVEKASKQESLLTELPNMSSGTGTSSLSDSAATISPGSFMQAFKNASRAEREGSYAHEGSEESQLPLQVKARLDQWSQISYKQRIAEALLQADKRLKRSIVSDEIVQTSVQLLLTIKKNGMLDRIDYKKLSGIPDIDRYIKDLVSSITFAPIPDRFSLSLFEFPVTIDVTLLKGTNRIRLYLV